MQLAHVVVFEADRTQPCSERALVLQSQGIKSEILFSDGRYLLLVAEENADAAREELLTYLQENVHWQPRHRPIKFDYQNPWPGVFGFILTMLILAWAAGKGLGDLNWYSVGKVDSGLVRNGEWWRTFTALTLHADVAHLWGNLVFGLVFGYFASQYLGSGVAWFSILLSGAVGNWLNSYLQSSSHTSVGASTAIFGALGLVAAFSWKRKLYPQDRWVYRIGPIVGGIALLAFTGTGGERTDVGAHLTGFVSGVAMGTVFAVWPKLLSRRSAIQWLAGVGTIGAVALSWNMALG